MNEDEYWLRLEYRVCREIDGLKDRSARIVWCDGFIPEDFLADVHGTRVAGYVWMGFGGTHQEKWTFTLLVDTKVRRRRQEVDWAVLFPPEDVTGWLSMDFEKRDLKVDPGAAYPDPSPS